MKKLPLEQKLFLVGFRPDAESHLRIIDQEKCRQCEMKPCTYICPVNTYRWENDRITVFFEGCLECGACTSPAPSARTSNGATPEAASASTTGRDDGLGCETVP